MCSRSSALREPKEKGLPSPHALRHTYASVANAIGVSETNLKLLLNHRSASVTQGYVAAYLESLRSEQERIAAFLLCHLELGEKKAAPVVALRA